MHSVAFAVSRLLLRAGLLVLLLLSGGAAAQEEAVKIDEISVTPGGSVRLLAVPPEPAGSLLLETAVSPAGPWWKEPDFLKTAVPGGIEFLTPWNPDEPRRFYRLGRIDSGGRPFIRYVSPNSEVKPGQAVTLLGAGFSTVAADHTVQFSLPNQTWTAAVTEASASHLTVTVPPNLTASAEGVLYRVTVTTAAGMSNGAGCTVTQSTVSTFGLRPSSAVILQAPGSGVETFVLGGGTPPYRLIPQTAEELAAAVAELTGPVLKVTGVPGVTSASLQVRVEDSSTPPQQLGATVTVQSAAYAPPVTVALHTLLGGSAPGFTMTVRLDGLQMEHAALRLENAAIDLSTLTPGLPLGLVRYFDGSASYGLQHMLVTEVGEGTAAFDLITTLDGGITQVAEGRITQNPPEIAIAVAGQTAASVMPVALDQELLFADGLVRLPPAGQAFSITTTLTSVSAREDAYTPQRHVTGHPFTAAGTAGPRLERLLPVHGEAGRHVRLRGTGFAAAAAGNAVTFTGGGGTRVPAEIVLSSPGEIVAAVPREAVTGPVQVAAGGQVSNGFHFAVRFRAEAELLFPSFRAGTPVAPRLLVQQPPDEAGTAGEVSLQRLTVSLNAGTVAPEGLTLNQQAGTAQMVNLSSGTKANLIIVYRGLDAAGPARHLFDVLGTNGASSPVWAKLSAAATSGAPGGGVKLTMERGTRSFTAGTLWDLQFTAPFYRPPASPGTDVNVRTEAVSAVWTAIPGSEMVIIENATQRITAP